MKIIGEKLSQAELLSTKGGCDLACYCGSLEVIIGGDNGQASFDALDAWLNHGCEEV